MSNGLTYAKYMLIISDFFCFLFGVVFAGLWAQSITVNDYQGFLGGDLLSEFYAFVVLAAKIKS